MLFDIVINSCLFRILNFLLRRVSMSSVFYSVLENINDEIIETKKKKR